MPCVMLLLVIKQTKCISSSNLYLHICKLISSMGHVFGHIGLQRHLYVLIFDALAMQAHCETAGQVPCHPRPQWLGSPLWLVAEDGQILSTHFQVLPGSWQVSACLLTLKRLKNSLLNWKMLRLVVSMEKYDLVCIALVVKYVENWFW